MEAVIGLLIFAAIVSAVVYAYGGPSMFGANYCVECRVKMKASGYIAHGFERHYVCPLCNWNTYVTDQELKRQKMDQISRGDAA